jgi:hypothetical protein
MIEICRFQTGPPSCRPMKLTVDVWCHQCKETCSAISTLEANNVQRPSNWIWCYSSVEVQNTKEWVRFKVLTAASIKMAVFWAIAPCSLVEVYRRVRGACCLRRQCDKCSDNGGSKHLWNVSKLLPDYTAQQPTRQPSSQRNYFLLRKG